MILSVYSLSQYQTDGYFEIILGRVGYESKYAGEERICFCKWRIRNL